jgi:hypothetical protein
MLKLLLDECKYLGQLVQIGSMYYDDLLPLWANEQYFCGCIRTQKLKNKLTLE